MTQWTKGNLHMQLLDFSFYLKVVSGMGSYPVRVSAHRTFEWGLTSLVGALWNF